MNAGAHGTETADVLVEARAVDRSGRIHTLSLADLAYTYRHCGAPEDLIFTEALYQGAPGDPDEIALAMQEVADYREANPADESAHGRLDLQEPARPQRLEADRRRGLPGSSRRRRACLGDALQFPHQ